MKDKRRSPNDVKSDYVLSLNYRFLHPNKTMITLASFLKLKVMYIIFILINMLRIMVIIIIIIIMFKDLKTLNHKLLISTFREIQEVIKLKAHLQLKMEMVALYESSMS